MGNRKIEPAASPRVELPRPTDERRGLSDPRRTGVASDRHRVQPVELQEAQRLGIVPRGDLDLVAALAQTRYHRAKDDRVRGGGHVEPNLHRGRRGGPQSRRRGNRSQRGARM